MKKTYQSTLATLAILASAPLWLNHASAQQEEGKPPHAHRPPSPLVGIIDADHNHIISAEEIDASSQNLLALDQDRDGTLSSEELRPQPPKDAPHAEAKDQPQPPPAKEDEPGPRKDPRPPHSPIIKVLDTDADHSLSAEEIAAAPANLKTLDQDGNGSLEPAEFSPHPPHPNQEDPQAWDNRQGPPPAGPRTPRPR